jgi:hypothetical protein
MVTDERKQELERALHSMRSLIQANYWASFNREMGTWCHAFIEFNGVMSKYVDMCTEMLEQGIDFGHLNVHGPLPLDIKIHDHHWLYLIEKLDCIYGPLLRSASPRVKDKFVEMVKP